MTIKIIKTLLLLVVAISKCSATGTRSLNTDEFEVGSAARAGAISTKPPVIKSLSPSMAPSFQGSPAPSTPAPFTSAPAAPSAAPSDAPSDTPSVSPSAAVFVSINGGQPVNFDDIGEDDPIEDYDGLTWTNWFASQTSPGAPSPPRAAIPSNTLTSIESGPGEVFSMVSVEAAGSNAADPVTIRGFDSGGNLIATEVIDPLSGSYSTFDLTAFANVKRDRNDRSWGTRCPPPTAVIIESHICKLD
eukprot:scaffold8595_cov134-Cylindrotheca_fusiformis.AAC.3